MKKNILILIFFSIYLSGYSQFGGRRTMSGIPQNNTQPSERDIENRKQEIEERKQLYIANFLKTLEADEFQLEILKQALADFNGKIENFNKMPFGTAIEKKDALEALKNEHFAEVKSILSPTDSEKLVAFLNGDFKEKEAVKEGKKKKKKDKQ